MLLPVSHDRAVARRFPAVTAALLGVCFVVHVGVSVTERGRNEHIGGLYRTALEYADSHPSLRRPPLLTPGGNLTPPAEVLASLDATPAPEVDPAEQRILDDLARAAVGAVLDSPTVRFGYSPSGGHPETLLTYGFLHGGWLHLLFNGWFLWLSGSILEDRWGRLPYLAFYLLAVLAGAFGYAILDGADGVPVIGASGAVAAAMGGFLVFEARAKIRFLTLLWIRPFFFDAPAWLMLPLWAGLELLQTGVDDGVAHGAHVGGFAFGLLVAGGLRLSGLDRHLDRAVEEADTTHADPRLAEASELIDRGEPERALDLLGLAAAERPEDIDIGLVVLRAAEATGDPARVLSAHGRLMGLYARSPSPFPAAALYLELKRTGRAGLLPPEDRLFVAGALLAGGHPSDALLIFQDIHGSNATDATGVRALVGHGQSLALLGRVREAAQFFEEARMSPFSTVELDAIAARELAALEPTPPPEPHAEP